MTWKNRNSNNIIILSLRRRDPKKLHLLSMVTAIFHIFSWIMDIRKVISYENVSKKYINVISVKFLSSYGRIFLHIFKRSKLISPSQTSCHCFVSKRMQRCLQYDTVYTKTFWDFFLIFVRLFPSCDNVTFRVSCSRLALRKTCCR